MHTLNSNHDMIKHNQRHELWRQAHDRTSRELLISHKKQSQNAYDIKVETKATKGMIILGLEIETVEGHCSRSGIYADVIWG